MGLSERITLLLNCNHAKELIGVIKNTCEWSRLYNSQQLFTIYLNQVLIRKFSCRGKSMRHITISQFGQTLGVTGNRLVITDKNGKRWETALSRLRSIRIEKKGVSLSTNLILACALRGIRIFVLDWRHVAVAAVSGCNQHAVVALRQSQFECIKSDAAKSLAIEFIYSKLRNQRAVLLYFSKYLTKTSTKRSLSLKIASQAILDIAEHLWIKDTPKADWRVTLMGQEGRAAVIYWKALIEANLLPDSFISRQGRGATEITNAALNYGYSILQSYVWSALDNAGFELYAGFLHKPHIGRASLVMDFMEEYRAWIVDRNIIKLRMHLTGQEELNRTLKSKISTCIDETMAGSIQYRGKNVRLENILQRQAYRLGGAVVGECLYHGLRFKW